MARKHWWSFLVNEEGQPIENADVSIYLAGSTQAATIYVDEFASSSLSTAPQLKSNKNGYFEFWLPDLSKGEYSSNQKFKIEWDKTGIEYGYIDYIDIYPSFIPVDESSTDTVKDKSISNNLANLWETHRLDVSHQVHGIKEVDENDDLNTIKNRLVSNNLAYTWQDHLETYFTTQSTSAGSTHLVGDMFPHGIEPLNLGESIDVTEPEYWAENRLISYNYAKKWDDYVNENQFYPVNENDDNTDKDKLVSNGIINELLYGVRHSETVLSHNWSPSGGDYYIDVVHGLSEDYPSVQVWNTDSRQQISPDIVESIDTSTIRVWNSANIDANIIILK